MKVSILASGSNGNATLIETTNDSFLIDDGLSFKNLYSRICECQLDIHKLSSIFLTHEHIDHIAGVKVLLKKVPLKCYLSQGTYNGLNSETKEQVDLSKYIIKDGDVIELNGCKITVLKTHHDAREPLGYVIEEENKKA